MNLSKTFGQANAGVLASSMISKVVLAIFLAICLLLTNSACVAQEIETNNNGHNAAGAIFAPAGYIELTAPLGDRVAVNVYGYYIGEVGSGIVLLEAPYRATKFLTVTPSYLYAAVPASGVDLLSRKSGAFTPAEQEHQFRLAGTLKFSVGRFKISDRNLYARRFRPTGGINRYRNRIQVAHPLVLGKHSLNVFAFDEGYYDWAHGGWIRNWASIGLDVSLAEHVTFEPSYIRQDAHGIRSINFIGLGVIAYIQ
jgi:hypothetical protein